MLIKNTSERSFNLESGVLPPGSTGKATFTESKLLLPQGLAVMADAENPENDVSETNDEAMEPEAGSLEVLKVEAERLGITFHPMIKAASLQRKIDEAMGARYEHV